MAAPLPVPTAREQLIEQLNRSHRLHLANTVRRVLPQAAAVDEVVQESFERLLRWKDLEQSSPEIRIGVLFRTAMNLALDRIRRARTAERAEVTLAADHASPAFDALAGPEKAVMAQQAIQCLNEIVDSLPERLREPMVLRYVEDLSVAAVSARLGISQKNLEQRLTEARAICRERMTRVGFDLPWLD